ncbi:hypothetical protein ACP4OV_016275 [Aristida adscensionis]
MSSGETKTSWPEVVGLPGEAAKQKILANRPDVQVFVLPVGSIGDTQFNTKRVRVFVDQTGNVAQVPRIG